MRETGGVLLHQPPGYNMDKIEVSHACRLSLFSKCWRKICHDDSVLEYICGYSIPFATKPYQHLVTKTLVTEDAEMFLSIDNLLTLGAISPCTPCKDQFVSKHF